MNCDNSVMETYSASPYNVGILTVSDRCSQGLSENVSSRTIENEIEQGNLGNCVVNKIRTVPDEMDHIMQALWEWINTKIDLIITTGGTGFAPRDVTPEATKKVITKEAPGITLALLSGSLKITPYAMLSRLVCGITQQTLIINLPGSPKACKECLEIIKPILPHALNLINNEQEANKLHNKMIKDAEIDHDSLSQVCISKVARRNRISPYCMISVAEAQCLIFKSLTRPPKIVVHLNNALGHVPYQNVFAKEPFPPFRSSVKDGYAVIAADGVGVRKVICGTTAGDFPEVSIKSGECVRITTGAAIPPGADAVVQVEDTLVVSETSDGEGELEIEILKAPKVGLDIREIGSDIRDGEVVLKSGVILTSAELGILATLGICEITVTRPPKIGVLSTGNEIVSLEEKLSPGKIRDSNKTTLTALLKENYFDVIDYGIVTDNPNKILAKVKSILRNVDVLITSGGVSMGEYDLLTDILIIDLKAKLHFGRVNMKPGKPTKYFTLLFEGVTKHIFALPGNPVSAIVTCHLFVLPALRSMRGEHNTLPTIIKVKVSSDINLDERCEYARATLQWKNEDPVPWASLTGNQMSCRMLSMVSANCLLHLPAATETVKCIKTGDIVDAQIIRKL